MFPTTRSVERFSATVTVVACIVLATPLFDVFSMACWGFSQGASLLSETFENGIRAFLGHSLSREVFETPLGAYGSDKAFMTGFVLAFMSPALGFALFLMWVPRAILAWLEARRNRR